MIPTGDNVKNGKLRSVLKKCFSLRPEDRFQTFTDLRGALAVIYEAKKGKPAHRGVVELDMSTLRPGKINVYHPDLMLAHRGVLLRVVDFISTDDKQELAKLKSYIKQQLRLWPQSYDLRLALARIHQAVDQDSRAAISELSAAIEIPAIPSEKKACAFYDLGLNLLGLGKYDEATDAFREAIRLDPTYGDTHFQLGLTFFHRFDFKEAHACAEEALRLNPDSEDAYLLLGRAFYCLGEHDKSQNAYRTGLSRIERSGRLSHFLAVSLMLRNRMEGAVETLEKAVARLPEDPRLYADLACAHLLNKKLQLAEEKEALCKRYSPPHDPAVLTLKVCVDFGRNGNWTLCRRAVRELLEWRAGALDFDGRARFI